MKRLIVRIWLITLTLQIVSLALPSAAYAHEGTCPSPTMVEIDVKPGDDDSNKINLSTRGLLPVAVLSTEEFNAALFTPEMAHLSDASTVMGCEGAEAVRWTYVDVNEDGLLDLVFFFRIQEINLTPESAAVRLMAHGMYGSTEMHIEGMDPVLVKP